MISTTVATISNPLGVAIGFVLPVLFVTDQDNLPENREDAKTNIFYSLLCQALIQTAVTIIIVVFYKEKPPTPPSASADTAN